MATRARILRDVLVDVAAIGWREEERARELPQVHVRKHEDFATSIRKNGLVAFNLSPFQRILSGFPFTGQIFYTQKLDQC